MNVTNMTSAAAVAINAEHRLARASAESAIQHAIRAGQLLMEQKASLKHGEFLDWVSANCEFKYATANRYIRAAREKSHAVELSALRHLFPSGRLSAREPERNEIPLKHGHVTLGTIGEHPAFALFESRRQPGFWHDIDVIEGTSSMRPVAPIGLRHRFGVRSGIDWRVERDDGRFLTCVDEAEAVRR